MATLTTAVRPATPLAEAIRAFRAQILALGIPPRQTHYLVRETLACRAAMLRGGAA